MSWFLGMEKNKLLHKGSRSGASPGLWLATLLPVGFTVNVLRHDVDSDYYTIATLSWMILCSQVLILWRLVRPTGQSGNIQLWSIAFAGLITSFVVSVVIGQSVFVALSSGLLVTFAVHWVFCGLFRYLPKSFTIGEAAVVGQGLSLFLFKSLALDFPRINSNATGDDAATEEVDVKRIVELGVLMIFLLIGIMKIFVRRIRNVFVFSGIAGLIGIGILAIPVTEPIPVRFVLRFLISDMNKIIVLVIYGALVAVTGGFCYWHTSSNRPTSTAIRKSFHLVIVLVFLIGVLYQRTLLTLCTGVTFAIFLLLEALRIANVDHVSIYLEHTVKSFVDGQDSGLIALTPIYLLVGHAAPLFLCPLSVTGGNDVILPLLSGVISVGVGDSFAGLVGSLYGRHLWTGSRKSIEGTVANAVSQLVFIAVLILTGFLPLWTNIPEYIICIGGVVTNAIVEAKTDQVDNLAVPLLTLVIFSLI